MKTKTNSMLISVFIVLCLFNTACMTYYKAEVGYGNYSSKYGNSISVDKSGTIVVKPVESCSTGFIFYPGGCVDNDAYLPLMDMIASYGINVYLVKMPMDLALFGVNAADSVRKHYAENTEWYIGGHSLGGAMASSHVSKRRDTYKGLVLLAAYSASDISDSGTDVICIYGSKDQVLNKEKYEKNKVNLPSGYVEYIIEGGNHGQFGSYGFQEGDSESDIDQKQQQNMTAALINDFVY